MRRTHHNTGSDAAQQTLLNMAGWTPNRRSFVSGLTGMLALGAVPAAAALPEIAPVPDCAPAPTAGVSPRMAALVADLMRHNAALTTEEDADRWTDAADRWSDAMTALVNERPQTLADYAAKITAIAQVEQPDGCGEYPLRRLAEDVTALVGSAK